MGSLQDRTVFVTGASRGIGRAIALRAARDGARVVIAAKTVEPHPKLPGTIHSVADEVREAGGNALAVRMDVRSEDQVAAAVERAVAEFGGIDVLVNNASAIQLTPADETSVKRFDLMWEVNARGTFVCSKACEPHLAGSPNPHILMLAPPVDPEPRWLAGHTPYTISKYGMSLLALGMAVELADRKIAVNALWPRTVIATAALAMLGGRVKPENCRTPEIVADAAHAVVTRDSRACTGRLLVDEEVLRQEGVTDFDRYRVDPHAPLLPDLYQPPLDGSAIKDVPETPAGDA